MAGEDVRRDFVLMTVANYFGLAAQHTGVQRLYTSRALARFLDDPDCLVLAARRSGDEMALSDTVDMKLDAVESQQQQRQVLVFFKLRAAALSADNVHSCVLVSSLADSPVLALYHAVRYVYGPLLTKGRMNLSSLDTEIFPVGLPRPGDVIELHGPEGSGKTEVVYRLLASCVLPVEAGGLGMRAILLDADLHFDLLRLVGMLERRIRAAKQRPGQAGDHANSHIGVSVGGSDGCADGIVETGGNCASGCGNVGGGSGNCVSGSTSGPGGPTGDRQCLLGGNRVVCENKCNVDGDRDLITEDDDDDEAAAELALRGCLSCLSIATCHTVSQLELTLLALEEQVALPPLLGSNRPHVGLLVLDGLSAFYWMDQPCPGSTSVTERCCEVLSRMARQQGLVLIATTQQLFRPWRQQASRGAGPRPLLGRAWHALVTLRFVFGRDDGVPGAVSSKIFSMELDRAPGDSHFRRSFVIGEDGVRLL